ncbi:MAG TPA: hypothetical protein VLK56_03235 [Solirubrobacterales bacterium]|nr:hypothetical protein [Solirubrobacterales bacterium]
MTRNLKTLGLAVLAAFALSAVAASAAQAEKFTAAEYPAILHAEPTTHTFEFANGLQDKCSTTISGELTEASEKVHLVPKYSECSAIVGGVKKSVTTISSCEEGLDHYDTIFSTRTICKKGYIHIITVFNNAEQTEVLCKYELSALEGEKVTHENLGGTAGIKVTWAITGVAYKRTAGSVLVCGAAEGKVKYNGTSSVSAKNKGGSAIGFDVG